MSSKLERLAGLLREKLGERVRRLELECGELNLDVAPGDYSAVALMLRDDPALGFEQLMDLSGIDYRDFAAKRPGEGRFAAVVHLLSVSNNWRLRLRVFAEDADFPVLDSLVPVWPSANWYEREAFDLYGILFNGHPDLRRILTDYGFVGHPFRKDFPISGFVEMRYDPEAGRVVYQPVSIEPRENTPRIVREDTYGDVGHG